MGITTPELWREAQCKALGCCLLSPEAAKVVTAETREEDYQGHFREVFDTIRLMQSQNEPVTPLGIMTRVGPAMEGLLQDVVELTPSAANVGNYVLYLRQQSRGERLRLIAHKMAASDEYESRKALMMECQQLLDDRDHQPVKAMNELLGEFSRTYALKPEYLQWSPAVLDGKIFTEPGDLVVIGGYPSSGKSAFAIQCAALWARKWRVGFYSLETSSKKVTSRLVSNQLGVRLQDIKNQTIPQDQWEQLMEQSRELEKLKLEVVEAAGMTVADVLATARSHGHQVVIVDYLQLLRGSGGSRYEQVTAISRDLQTMARTTGIIVVALSQLRRNEGGTASPGMSDLRESGQIEQDADLIALMYKADPHGTSHDRILKIAKNKEGECLSLRLAFDGDHQRFFLAETSPTPERSAPARSYSAQERYERKRVPHHSSGMGVG